MAERRKDKQKEVSQNPSQSSHQQSPRILPPSMSQDKNESLSQIVPTRDALPFKLVIDFPV